MLKTRTLSFLLLVSFFAFTVACKKSSDDSNNVAESTMSFKVDGAATTYSTCLASFYAEDSSTILAVAAASGADANASSMSFGLTSTSAISSGFKITENYNTDDSKGFLNFVTDHKAYSTINASTSDVVQLAVTISERTSTNVKGTFSGKLYSEDNMGGGSFKTVTEGKFNAKISQQ